MRKVHLNSGVVQENSYQLLDDMNTMSNYIEAIEMFVTNPGPNCDATVKQALSHIQKQLDKVMGYMGVVKVNSAKLPIGGNADSDDTAFLEDVDSVLGLENGESIDMSKAQLLYNQDTLELMLTDEDDIPDGFEVVGTVVETEDTENAAEDAAGDESEEPENPDEDTDTSEDASSAEDTSNAEEPAQSENSEEKPAEESEGGIF